MWKNKIKNILGVTNCRVCGILLTEENAKFSGSSLISICLNCNREYNKNYMRKNLLKSRNTNLKRNYNITLEEFNKILQLQNNRCAICKKENKFNHDFHLDHDHGTGRVRGILCHSCNLAIGYLNEDEDIFWNALEYLKKHKWCKAS